MRKIYNCFFLLLFLFFIGCEKKEDSSRQQPQFANMKDYVTHKCSTCHSITRVFEKARTPQEWSGIVRRMGRCNPQFVNAEDQQKTLEYLVTNEFVSKKGKEKPE
jgi:catalase